MSDDKALAMAAVYACQAREVASSVNAMIAHLITDTRYTCDRWNVRRLWCNVQNAQALLAECASVLGDEYERAKGDCDTCHGNGVFSVPSLSGVDEEHTCGDCDGTGRHRDAETE